MIARMAKVQIVGPRAYLGHTLRFAYHYGKIQLCSAKFADPPPGVEVTVAEPSADEEGERTAFQETLQHIERFLNLLADFPGVWSKRPKKGQPVPEPPSLSQVRKLSDDIAVLEARLVELNRAKNDLDDELKLLWRFEGIVKTFLPLMKRLEQIRHLEVIGFTVKKKQAVVVDLLRSQLEKASKGEFEVFTEELDPATLAGIISFPSKLKHVVESIFLGSGISEVTLPSKYGDRPLPVVLEELQRRLESIPREMDTLDKETESLLADLDPHWLRDYQTAVSRHLATLGALPEVGSMGRVFILVGWLPEKHFEEFNSLASRELPPEVAVFRTEITHDDVERDRVPVRLHNPRFLRPFELCLKLVPLPRYGSVDPTPFVAVFFPTFFGLILGDVGYGAILAILAGLSARRFREKPLIRDASIILLVSGLSAIFCGLLFGEFFGDLGHRMGIMPPLLFNREEALFPTLFLAVGIGVAHVILGIVLKLIGALRHHQKRHAGEALGTIITLVALILMLAVAVEALPRGFFTTGVVMLLVGLPLLLICGGVICLLELFGIMGNMLSYARIMAIGFSSVILAVVANRMAGAFGNLLVGVLLAVLLHLINLLIGIFGSSIHSLRLHYVEFFGKFYIPGRRPYEPFCENGDETREVEA